MAQNLFFARIGDARREYVGKGHRCLEKRHVGPKENSLCSDKVDATLEDLKRVGSFAARGFMQPEGVVVFHAKSGTLFKKTLDKNDGHKGV